MLYGSDYTAFMPARADEPRPDRVRLVGKHCESGDVIVRSAPVPAGLAAGDLVATPVTGAYGYSMGAPYNRIGRPAVVFVADGDARLVIRRETVDRHARPRRPVLKRDAFTHHRRGDSSAARHGWFSRLLTISLTCQLVSTSMAPRCRRRWR